MKKKYSRILGVALTLMLLASFFGFAAPVSAATESWSAIVPPRASLPFGMNLADVEVGPIAVTPDGGTIFAAVGCETAIAGISMYVGTFGLPAAGTVVFTATAANTVGSWTLAGGTVTVGTTGTATTVGTSFTMPTAGDTLTLTFATAVAATSTYAITNGAVTVAVTGAGVEVGPIPMLWAVVKSIDGGHNWAATGLRMNGGPIRGIAVSSNFATDNTMYVAAGVTVRRSNNGGVSFITLKAVPVDSGATATTRINSVAMYPASPYPYVMVGTNSDVWVLQDMPFGSWMDQEIITGAGLWVDVMAVAFAPDFATSNYIWAVVGNSSAPAILGRVTTTNSPGAWGTILGNTTALLGAAAVSADIGFPSDYSSTTAPYLWVALNDGAAGGGIWRIRGLFGLSQAIPQLAALDIRSIAVSGPMAGATILAGQEVLAGVRISLNGGLTFLVPCLKQPTGSATASQTRVVMAPDFATATEKVAYIGTSDGGTTDSAFSVSRNGGLSWNQTGLIDIAIASIDDLAVVSLDTIFMVTSNSDLWKTINATAAAPTWERILSDATVTVPGNTFIAGTRLDLVETSPSFATDGVVLVTNMVAAAAVMKSTDGGDIFAPMGAPGLPITALHVVDTTFAFTGAAGQVYRTDDGAYSWLAAAVPPAGSIVTITTSPDYATDGTMLVGNNAGAVYMSARTRGATFAIVGAVIAAAGDNVHVAFDPGYATNSIIYAGSDGATTGADGVWRWYVGTSIVWAELLDAAVPGVSVADVTGLIVSPDGTLYAADLNPVPAAPVPEGTGEQGGVQRSLNPTAARTAPSEAAIAPVFEAVTDNLTVIAAGATFNGLWLVVDETLDVVGSKNVLFSIDLVSVQILTYTDTLAAPVVLLEPEADAIFPRAASVTLQWETLTGARMYFWEIARDALFFLNVDSGFSAYPTDISNAVVAGRTYYWRVRVDGVVAPAGTPGFPLLSRWSETRTFTTYLGARPWSPVLTNVQEVYDQVPLKPSFQWTGADWATGYEFVLADNANLTSSLVSTTVNTTAYVCTVELKYSTAYFWQVRAISGTSESEWSDVGTFTTIAEPVEALPPVVIQEVPDITVEQPDIVIPAAVEATPTWALLVIIIIGAVLVVSVVVLIVRTRRPI